MPIKIMAKRMVVLGAGTGGTLTGTAEALKEHWPDCHVVGVDPVGSILADETEEVKPNKKVNFRIYITFLKNIIF